MIALQASRSPAHLAAVAGLRYQLCPRANIFRRDQGAVEDMASFKVTHYQVVCRLVGNRAQDVLV